MYVVYQITHKISKKFYIGKTNITDWNNGYMGSGKLIKRAVKRHGSSLFYRVILNTFNNETDAYADEAFRVTQEEVDNPMCYNLCVGGLGGAGTMNIGENNPCYGRTGDKHPMYGKKRPDNKIRAQSMRGANNPMFGKKRPEFAKKMKALMLGKMNKQHSKRMTGKNNHQFGVKHTAEREAKRQLTRLKNKMKLLDNPIKD